MATYNGNWAARVANAGSGDEWVDVDMSATTVIDLASALSSRAASGDNWRIQTGATIHRYNTNQNSDGLILVETVPVTYADLVGVAMRLDIVTPDATNTGIRGVALGISDSDSSATLNHGLQLGAQIAASGQWSIVDAMVANTVNSTSINPDVPTYMDGQFTLHADKPIGAEMVYGDGTGDLYDRPLSTTPAWTSPGSNLHLWCAFHSTTTTARDWTLRWRYKLITRPS